MYVAAGAATSASALGPPPATSAPGLAWLPRRALVYAYACCAGLLAFDLDLSPYPGLLAAADAIAALACAQPETASTLAKSPEGR